MNERKQTPIKFKFISEFCSMCIDADCTLASFLILLRRPETLGFFFLIWFRIRTMSMILRSMKENFSFFLLTAIDFLVVHRRWRCSSRMNYAVNSFSRSFDFFNWMNGQFDCLFLIASIQWLCQVDHFSLIRSFSSSQNIHHFLVFFCIRSLQRKTLLDFMLWN